MKKLLSAMLAVTLVATLISGCTPAKESVKPTDKPSASATVAPDETPGTTPSYDPTPTPTVQVAEQYIPNFDDIIEFNTFNEDDFQARWNDATKEYLLEKYKLKVARSIPGVTGYEGVATVIGGDYMSSEAKRLDYNNLLSQLYLTEETTPDFYTSLFASSTAANAPWLEFQSQFVDLSPYLEEDGPLYQGYLNYVWEGDQDYWNTFRNFLENDDGELFVLPRREKMPIKSFVGWNKDALKAINIKWEDKATDWATLVEQLTAYHNLSNSVALESYCGSITDYLKFIAYTYGLDYSEDFAWTVKNGEPLWTYCWDEYLSILTDLKTLAERNLVYNDNTKTSLPLGYSLNPKDAAYKKVAGAESKWQNRVGSSGLVIFSRPDTIAVLNTKGRSVSDLDTWHVSDTNISHNGYEASLFANSEFDIDYIAIGSRIDNKRGDSEFSLRICQYLAEYMTEEGFLNYQFGKEGLPFADTLEEAGNWVWVDIDGEQKVLWSGHENRISWTRDTASPSWDAWFWEGRSDNWYAENLDPHYEQYINYVVKNEKTYKNEIPEFGNGDKLAELIGINDTKVFDNTDGFRKGVYFFSDRSAYPMEYTAYWRMESEYEWKPIVEQMTKSSKESGNVVSAGFFKSVDAVLSGESVQKLNENLSVIKTIAKNFTKDFLANKRDASTWTSYLKDIKDNGYEDVYDYYRAALTCTDTPHVDTIKSQSDINKAQFGMN